jgi:hypothetical protein
VQFPSACIDAIQAGVDKGGEEGLREEQRQACLTSVWHGLARI